MMEDEEGVGAHASSVTTPLHHGGGSAAENWLKISYSSDPDTFVLGSQVRSLSGLHKNISLTPSEAIRERLGWDAGWDPLWGLEIDPANETSWSPSRLRVEMDLHQFPAEAVHSIRYDKEANHMHPIERSLSKGLLSEDVLGERVRESRTIEEQGGMDLTRLSRAETCCSVPSRVLTLWRADRRELEQLRAVVAAYEDGSTERLAQTPNTTRDGTLDSLSHWSLGPCSAGNSGPVCETGKLANVGVLGEMKGHLVDLEVLRTYVKRVRTRVDACTTSIGTEKSLREAAERQVQVLREDAELMRVECESRQTRVVGLERELQELRNLAKAEKASLSEEVRCLKSEVRRLDEEGHRFRSDAQRVRETERETFGEEVRRLKGELAKLNGLEEVRQQAHTREGGEETHRVQVRRLREELAELRALNEFREEEVQSARRRLREDRALHVDRVAHLEAQMCQVRREAQAEYDTREKALREHVRRLNGELAAARTLHESDRKEVRRLNGELAEARTLHESEVRRLNGELAEARTLHESEVRRLNGELAEARTLHDDAREQAGRLQRELLDAHGETRKRDGMLKQLSHARSVESQAHSAQQQALEDAVRSAGEARALRELDEQRHANEIGRYRAEMRIMREAEGRRQVAQAGRLSGVACAAQDTDVHTLREELRRVKREADLERSAHETDKFRLAEQLLHLQDEMLKLTKEHANEVQRLHKEMTQQAADPRVVREGPTRAHACSGGDASCGAALVMETGGGGNKEATPLALVWSDVEAEVGRVELELAELARVCCSSSAVSGGPQAVAGCCDAEGLPVGEAGDRRVLHEARVTNRGLVYDDITSNKRRMHRTTMSESGSAGDEEGKKDASERVESGVCRVESGVCRVESGVSRVESGLGFTEGWTLGSFRDTPDALGSVQFSCRRSWDCRECAGLTDMVSGQIGRERHLLQRICSLEEECHQLRGRNDLLTVDVDVRTKELARLRKTCDTQGQRHVHYESKSGLTGLIGKGLDPSLVWAEYSDDSD